MGENNSEIAQIRAQIEHEHAAAVWALNGLATGTAQRAFLFLGVCGIWKLVINGWRSSLARTRP